MVEFLVILAGLLLVWGGLQCLSARAAGPPSPFSRPADRPLRIAHRGYAAKYPENTLGAFAAAINDGAEAIELDVHLSKDGVPVVIHDPTLERTTNGCGPVRAHTAVDLSNLRATPPGGGVEEGIPTLEAVFERFPHTPLLVEVKTVEVVPAVVGLIERFARRERTLIGSFSGRALLLARKLDPDLPTCASRIEVAYFFALAALRLDHLYNPPFRAFSLPPKSGMIPLTFAPFRRAARSRRLPLLYWTINDPIIARELAELGADGIMSDDSDVLSAL